MTFQKLLLWMNSDNVTADADDFVEFVAGVADSIFLLNFFLFVISFLCGLILLYVVHEIPTCFFERFYK